jgi:anti-sigma regulatory factor (Ser/Thr protein kinase)
MRGPLTPDRHAIAETFGADPGSARAARQWCLPFLRSWAGSATNDSLLVLSELVTNAIVHGSGPIDVRVMHRDNEIRIEVSDQARGVVAVADRGPEALGGRGLLLVRELAARWGVDPGDPGKTVWAELPVDPSGERPDQPWTSDGDDAATRDRVMRVLEGMGDAFFTLGADWRFTYLNREAERVLEHGRADLLGKVLWEEFPLAAETVFGAQYRRAVESGQPTSFDAYLRRLRKWYEVRAFPGPEGLAVTLHDASERRIREVERRRAREAEIAANERLQLLAESTARLSETLEPDRILDALVSFIVPGLSDWLVLALCETEAATIEGREPRTTSNGAAPIHVVRLAHRDPERVPMLARAIERLRLSDTDEHGPGAVIRTGRSEHLDTIPDVVIAAIRAVDVSARPPGARDNRRRRMVQGSVLSVPLACRGRVLGALTVVSADPYRALNQTLIEDLGRRAAVALDNASLYRLEQRNAVALQRSLLPGVLSRPPGVEVASRYLPATTGAEVGGDWYDTLMLRDERLGLVIGDVMGHSIRAAALMGQLRACVGTLALEGHRPDALLTQLSRDIDRLLDLPLATVLYGIYDARTRQLALSSAGHPPPLLAPPDGPAVFLDVQAGPPLGTGPGEYTETVVEVAPGSVLLLYTDGLVEDRDQPIDEGMARLAAVFDEHSGMGPDEAGDRALSALGRELGGRDDVALLVVRQP